MPRTGPWLVRIAWLALPVTAGGSLTDALGDVSGAVRWVAAVGLWAAWAGGLLAALVPRTTSLTALRVLAPAALAATVWATLGPGDPGPADAVALGWTALTVVIVLSAATADVFVDGSSYGAERRFLLRAPAPLVFGPIPLAWAVAVAGVVTGPLLLAAGEWVLGAVAVVVGAPLVAGAVRALHQLSRRWLVFVPAGVVLHDPLTLHEPVLFPRRTVAAVGPAPAADEQVATDLTSRAAGLVLELRVTTPVKLTVVDTRLPQGRSVDTDRLLFAPARPGALLAECGERRLNVG